MSPTSQLHDDPVGNSALLTCEPSEAALKSFFLGPQAENAPWLSGLVQEILQFWFQWRREYFPEDGAAVSAQDRMLPAFQAHHAEVRKLALDLLHRYEAEVPKFSPRYIGHMFSEISMPALIGHLISLLHNPNIIASEAGRVAVRIENEAIEALLTMVGFDPEHGVGHFTSGGTVANYEAVLRARERSAQWMARGLLAGETSYFQAAHSGWDLYQERNRIPDEDQLVWSHVDPWTLGTRLKEITGQTFRSPVLIIPRSKHYSWIKAAHLIGLGDDNCWQIALDEQGKMSVTALEEALHRAQADDRPILMVVTVAGTTELGEVDHIDKVQDLLDHWKREHGIHIWHHVDGAYGAFLRTLGGARDDGLKPEVWAALEAMARVDSITIDPHKLGYVPYACGAFLTRVPSDYFVTCHDAPYIQYNGTQDRGKYTLEGSRSAGGATATWLTAKSIGLHPGGYGLILARTIRMRRELEKVLAHSGLAIHLAPAADTNILCFHAANPREQLSHSNHRTESLYQSFMKNVPQDFYVSKTILHLEDYGAYLRGYLQAWQAEIDEPQLVLIRLCLMNPFFQSQEMNVDFCAAFLQHVRAHFGECLA